MIYMKKAASQNSSHVKKKQNILDLSSNYIPIQLFLVAPRLKPTQVLFYLEIQLMVNCKVEYHYFVLY